MKKQNKENKNEIIVFQNKSGAIEFKGDFEKETLWATQMQIANAFDINIRTVNEHIKNIYKTEELSEKPTIRNFRIVQREGKREVERDVQHYNLDMILSIGYRVNSKKATMFRQWATKTLRQHITEGYTINKKQLAKNYDAFLSAVEEVKKLLPSGGQMGTDDALDLIKMFASTWLSLEAYDEEALPKTGAEKKHVSVTAENIQTALAQLRLELISQREASELFGVEKQEESISGIIGNVFQSFGGNDLYPTLEEKAAHLLYFMVKNHPFIDGNKRSGAFSFVWFLQKAKILNVAKITPEALTSLTLLVAESNPHDKERMIGLILMLLKR